MALKVSLIITGIAIGLLVLYGADVAASMGGEGGKSDGFLPLDDMQRGMGLGGPALLLPIIAFFISLKEPSKGLGGMIIIAGVLASGKILGKNPLAAIMKSAVSLKEEGWDKLTWLWVGMFIVMAIANEIAWRNLTTDQWVSFKAFGIPILSLGFGLLSLPIMQKYQIKKD